MKKKTKEQLLEEFSTKIQKIFEENPLLQEITWRQYTPYFNDGAPCVFEVNDFAINNYSQWELTIENRKAAGFTPAQEKEIQDLSSAATAMIDFREVFSGKDHSLLFGDHAEVFITKGSIRIESYEHE
jgi:hypothetical protein